MSTLEHLCLLLIFVFHLHITRGEHICNSMSCGEIDIQFPFGLKASNQGGGCSYPRFQLSCDNQSNTILTLPSGDLVVKSINYEDQTIQVNDPAGCLPKRFLQNLSFSGSPFMFDTNVYDFYNLTFLRCPSNVTESYPLPPISCLRDPSSHMGNSESSSVIVSSNSWWQPSVSSALSECEVMSWALVPIPKKSLKFDLTSDIELMWSEPTCGDCAVRGQVCGFNSNTSLQVGCFSSTNDSQGLPRSAKYGLAMGVGIPGLLCIIGLCYLLCINLKMHTYPHRPSTVLPNPTTTISLQPAPLRMGLDRPTIEKFPMTVIGDSGLLPKPNDNTCPICLSEYEPKEALRTIPYCKHCFHAHCIDEWLKMNATCPLCRNSPDASSTVTPSSSTLSISSSLASSAQINQVPTHIFAAV